MSDLQTSSSAEVEPDLLGGCPAMAQLREKIRKAAGSRASVLLFGETGAGKELVAKSIHFSSRRCDRPFVAVNCGALSTALLESELFGYQKGAFTGAVADSDGKFAAADGGTLFLDEINSSSPDFQVKLLRVLQDGCFTPVGGNRVVHADVRVLAATNQTPELLVKEGKLRNDLLYRLNVIRIDVPALRDRGEDILLLAQHFLAKYSREECREFHGFSVQGQAALRLHSWPGNVRELENCIQRAVVMAERDGKDQLLDVHLDSTTSTLADDRGNAIADAIHDALLNRSVPLEGLRQGSSCLGPAAAVLLDAVLLGLDRYLASEAGQDILSRTSAQGYVMMLMGLSARSAGSESIFTRKVRAGIKDAVRRHTPK